MDSDARLSAPAVDPLSVGKAFVVQYYHILYNTPENLHRFYKENSKVGRVGQDGVMRDFSISQDIGEELKTMPYGDLKYAEITSYDIQESHSMGFLLVVTGYFALNERLRRKFTQTFFLAPQENGYFVLNDILRFVSEPEATDGVFVSEKDSETSNSVNAPTGNKGSEKSACMSVNSVSKEVPKPLNNSIVSVAKDNVLVPEIVNEEVPDIEITCKKVADDSLKISYRDAGMEYLPKKSYASVLKVTKDKSGVSVGPIPAPKQIPKDQEYQAVSDPSSKQIPKDQEHQAASDPSPEQIAKDQGHKASSDPSPEQIAKDQGHKASSDPSPVIESDGVSEAEDAPENENNEGFEVGAEGTSIYVKHLPENATIGMLETEFKQFGAISNGGIQVVNQRGFGFPYGFVEFKEADAAQRAVEASPIIIGGQKAYVEAKRSRARGGNRGSGNEYGNRNVGGRGRGTYGYGNNYRRGGGRYFNRRGYEYVPSSNTY